MAHSRLRLGLIGCGGMGTRHMYGMKELDRADCSNLDLVAVCDVRSDYAALAAQTAEELFGARPREFTEYRAMLRQTPDLDAVLIATDPSFHHTVAIGALEEGAHVLVEKPMALTVNACRAMLAAAQRANRIIAVAENLRRDPPNRLIKELMSRNVIGKPFLMVQNSFNDGHYVFITPWRHLKNRGGHILDMGVHYTDMIIYYLGELDEVSGYAALIEPKRYKREREGWQLEIFQRRLAEMGSVVEATAEDICLATYRTVSGAMVQWGYGLTGFGYDHWQRVVCGPDGTIEAPGERNGNPVKLRRRGYDEVVGDALFEMLPDFQLDEVTARLFQPRKAEYRLSGPEVDAKHLAIEQHDFARAVLAGSAPEVDGVIGLKAVAAANAILESATLGRPVKLRDVESGQINVYQAEIDAAIGM